MPVFFAIPLFHLLCILFHLKLSFFCDMIRNGAERSYYLRCAREPLAFCSIRHLNQSSFLSVQSQCFLEACMESQIHPLFPISLLKLGIQKFHSESKPNLLFIHFDT